MNPIEKPDTTTLRPPSQSLNATCQPPSAIPLVQAQTRTRRLFSTPQLFAFSVVYLGTGYYVAANMYFALANGGPAAWFFSYIVVGAGVLCQAASFGDLASRQPVAGAQYYWTWQLLAPSCRARRFLTWLQGWTTWTGYVALLGSCLNGNTAILEGLVQLGGGGYEGSYVPGGWHTALVMIGTVVACALVNMYAFRLVPWFELLAGVLNVVLVVVVFVVVWALAPARNSPAILLEMNVSTGWGDHYFVAANLGALSNIYLFICEFSLVDGLGGLAIA